ncbi:MAG: hypothetical protein BGO78_02770 [Chloroflexi bacterium 44-23]|nr:MAG: hypothetical protein BGO78_02770 [Chloroflexi bacterium 44-23]
MVEKKGHEMPRNPKIDEAREHMRSARHNMRKVVESMVPEGVLENRKAARKEFLLGLRSLLDAAIDHTEKHTS